MILTYRQRLIIHNLITAKLYEIEGVNLTLNDDCLVLKEFAEKLIDFNVVSFKCEHDGTNQILRTERNE